MLLQSAQFCCTILLKHNIIRKEDSDIYRYGFELLFSNAFTTLSILALSYIAGLPLAGWLYLLISIPLKTSVGGYHAPTYRKCYILSMSCFLSIIALNYYLSSFSLFENYLILILIPASLYIFQKAPVKNANHPVGTKVLKRNRTRARIYVSLFCLVLFLLYSYGYNRYWINFCVLTVTAIALFIIPTQFKRRISYDTRKCT